jgi:glycosyltransferase involved in cell wall biosynthesis
MLDPVFAFLAFTSGSLEGAIIRDMRLANALHRRGWRVVVYWMMERNAELVDRGIPQRMLCGGLRYQFKRPSALMDWLGGAVRLLPPATRRTFVQRHPAYVDRLMTNCCRSICDGGQSDPALVRRLLRLMRKDGVTHLLPTFAMICPFALAAKERRTHSFDYLVTFQGEELFANYAQRLGRLDEYHQRLREVVGGSPWPSIAVSADYARRLTAEMGIDAARLTVIPPGIEMPTRDRPPFEALRRKFPQLRPDRPFVTYLGRQDSEKGIDLLLYAVKMLREQGIDLDLVVCGGTSFGERYRDVLVQMSQHLRLGTYHRRRVPDEVRDALYAHSRCIVYPSIHREPFGLVAAEAMSHGTPVLVPNYGGVAEVVEVGGRRGGLTFNVWDSGDLARQLRRLVCDDDLHRELSANARQVAANFTVDRMADRVLELLGLPPRPEPTRAPASAAEAART